MRPKPMVEIGGKPMLWHVMHVYSNAGYEDFVVALGYKQEVVKEYFHAFYSVNNDLTVDLSTGKTTIRQRMNERWHVHLVDTGLKTQTGGRIKRLRDFIGDETLLEHEPLVGLARDGQLSCYKHDGFWQPMDTMRDRRLLEDLWASGSPPWFRNAPVV